MRAIYWRELRELALVGLPALALVGMHALGILVVATVARDSTSHGIGTPLLFAGAAFGALQGVLDARHASDPFSRHRAVPAGAVECARALAGLTWLAALVVVGLLGDLPSETAHARTRVAGRVAMLAGTWALMRFGLGDGFRGRLLVPAVAYFAANRVAIRADASLFVLALGITCLLARGRLRPVALALLAGWMVLEASYGLNTIATASLLDAYPSIGLDADGRVHYFERGVDGERRIFHRRLDQDRAEMRIWKTDGRGKWPDGRATLLAAPGAVEFRDLFSPLRPGTRPRAPYHVDAAHRSLAAHLNALEARRRRSVGAPIEWRREGARFVCYERGTRRAVAAFDVGVAGLAFVMGDGTGSLYLARTGELVRVEHDPGPRVAASSSEPIRVRVDVRRVAQGAGVRVKGSFGGQVLLEYASELVLVDRRGQVRAKDAWGVDERPPTLTRDFWRAAGGAVEEALGLVTVVGPVHPTGGTVRLRRFDDRGVRRADAVLRPVTFGEHLRAGWRGVLGLLRPPVLNVGSAASRPPDDWDELAAWWWRDPLLAGGRSWPFLVLSVLVGCWCARRAVRAARYRSASRLEGRFWTGIALLVGPLGLVWMRLLVRWTVVVRVGDGIRAAHLDAAPATDAPWPEPDRGPTDVIVPASPPLS